MLKLRNVAVLMLSMACLVGGATGQSQPPPDGDATAMRKAFEGIVAFSQSLSGWALLVAGGSIVTLVGTSYYRPKKLWGRLMYLFFIPGWWFLGHSMYYGVQVQRDNLGYLFAKPGVILAPYKGAINDDALGQILAFQHAMYWFGVWLVLFLLWWLCHDDTIRVGGGIP